MDTAGIQHSITANIYTNNNDVYVKQMQNGNKTFTMTIRNSDGNDVAVTQKNSGAHGSQQGAKMAPKWLHFGRYARSTFVCKSIYFLTSLLIRCLIDV